MEPVVLPFPVVLGPVLEHHHAAPLLVAKRKRPGVLAGLRDQHPVAVELVTLEVSCEHVPVGIRLRPFPVPHRERPLTLVVTPVHLPHHAVTPTQPVDKLPFVMVPVGPDEGPLAFPNPFHLGTVVPTSDHVGAAELKRKRSGPFTQELRCDWRRPGKTPWTLAYMEEEVIYPLASLCLSVCVSLKKKPTQLAAGSSTPRTKRSGG